MCLLINGSRQLKSKEKMTDNTKTELSNLIKDPKLEELSFGLHSPNIFSILNVTKAEIRHSNFLAWLMTPNESHNLNTIFIKWFLKEIFSSEKIEWANEFSLDSFNLNGIQIFDALPLLL